MQATLIQAGLSVVDNQQPIPPPTNNELTEEWVVSFEPERRDNGAIAMVTDHEYNGKILCQTRVFNELLR